MLARGQRLAWPALKAAKREVAVSSAPTPAARLSPVSAEYTVAVGVRAPPLAPPQEDHQKGRALCAAAPAPAQALRQPVLEIAGGGMWFYWKAGVLKFLQQHHAGELANVRLHGSSSGAIVAVLAASGVDLEHAAMRAGHVIAEHGVHDRLLGLLGVWGGIARRCLQELLPEDAHVRCTGRVRLRLTAWPSMQPIFLQRFHSKTDLIDAVLASGHLPFLLDGRLAASVRGFKAMDGAFCRWAWLLQQPQGLRRLLRQAIGFSGSGEGAAQARPASNAQQQGHGSRGAAANSSSLLLDYTLDERLGPLRLRFGAVRLRSTEGLRQLVQSGFEYGQRLQAGGAWAAWLGQAQAAAFHTA